MKTLENKMKSETLDLDLDIQVPASSVDSNFYDFIKNADAHPFNNRGRFSLENMNNFGKYDAREEEQIYKEAIKFKFEEPKQLTKLVRKEEMKRLK